MSELGNRLGARLKTAPPEKLLSICIPTFNRAAYLPEALESLLPQLGPDVELLVYDTGSTDGTPQLMKEFVRRCPALRFFHLDGRRGFDEAVLLLLEQARGEYVWFFGSDDVLKAGAVDVIRERLTQSAVRPSFICLNHDVVDLDGRLLISSNAGAAYDREFRDGRRSVAWLGLHLGYISACIFRRDPAFPVSDAKRFDGSMWMGMYLNLWSISRGGPALYVGRPIVRARRNPENVYNYGKIFCRNASRVFWSSRRMGIRWFTIYRAMNRTVRLFYLRFAVSRRCGDPGELDRAFPAMFQTCWIYPWFWLLIVPVRLCPSSLVRAIRNRLLARRTARNATDAPRDARESPVAPGARFRTLVRLRKFVARLGPADRILRATPLLAPAYRKIYARLRPRGTLSTRVRGHRLYLDPTDTVMARSLLTSGEWEPHETRIFAAVLEEGMAVVDVGANLGHYSLEAARRVGPAGRVVAFEPEPRNFELLCRNIEANHYANITPVRRALSNACGVARLAISRDNFGGHHIDPSSAAGDSIEVETMTLDEYFRGRPGKIDVVKMDAEGAEMSILEGMRELLSNNPDLILFTEFMPRAIRASGYDPEAYLDRLDALDFQLGILDQSNSRIEYLPSCRRQDLVDSLLREDRGRFYVDLLCLRGKAARSPFGPQTWWRRPVLRRAAHAGRG